MPGLPESFWQKGEMDMIYMNNAATSYPKPYGVVQAVSERIGSLPGAAGRAVYGGGKTQISCRRRIADLLKIENENRIVYTSNATAALNIGILGFPWRKGDVVITTEAEHNSVLRPLYRLKKQGVIDYHILPVGQDGRVSMETWKMALSEFHPRMAVFTHASNVTGAVHDVRELTAIMSTANCKVFLDASQSLGIVPVYPEEWGVDLVAFTGHKYMLGPQGTGGLYVAESVDLEPVFTGGTGIHSDQDEMPETLPLRLEAGTPNEPSFEGLNAALEWQEKHPVCLESIVKYINEIQDQLLRWGYRVVTVEGVRTPVISFASPVYLPDELGEILYGSYDIICRVGLHCAPKILKGIGAEAEGTVRISLSRFTTREEVDVLLEALEEIGKEHGTMDL